jgi:acyl-CoA dehydrogenase
MINLEMSQKMVEVRNLINNVSKSIMRPISRYYDDHEHEYSKELDIIRNMMSQPKKNKKEKGAAAEAKPEKPSTKRLGTNISNVLTVEEVCWGDAGFFLTFPAAGLGNAAIQAVATDEQMERFGDKWASMAITEPGSGSDSGSIAAKANLDGDEWVISGEKIFVTAAERAEVAVVWATVDKSAGKAGIKSFIVEKDRPGFKLEKLEHKLGIRSSDTGTYVFDDCRIPKDNILGNPEVKKTTEGFKGVMKTFDNTRPVVAAMALGVTRAALEFTREKMEESGIKLDYEQNSTNVGCLEREFYMMEANLEASRLLTWRAAWMADNGDFNNLEASMAKAKAARSGTLTAQRCCELLGPLGFSCEHLAEKWMRDVKITDIFEGTGQIQHLIVARNVLGYSSKQLK